MRAFERNAPTRTSASHKNNTCNLKELKAQWNKHSYMTDGITPVYTGSKSVDKIIDKGLDRVIDKVPNKPMRYLYKGRKE